MTREQAEAAGWKSCRRQGSSIVEWWRFLLTDESPSVMEHRIYGPEKHCLAAITAIERYGETVAIGLKALAECRAALDAGDTSGRLYKLEDAVMTLRELEAHHAG